MDCATCATSEKGRPHEGDLTLCLYCANVMAFTESMGLRSATQEDFDKLDPERLNYLNQARHVIVNVMPKFPDDRN